MFWGLTRPAPLVDQVAGGFTADTNAGALVFAAAGCASCHAAPGGEDKTILEGGYSFASDFGTFYAPNISPGPQGIGGWTLPEFTCAVNQGVSPEGKHYYPAFPYTSYTNMTQKNVTDLFAYMQELTASETPSKAHDVGFPFTIRRGLGLLKQLYMSETYVLSGPRSKKVARGRYLVETLAHCGECHTPRNAIGGLDKNAWLGGAPNPSGKGQIPNITPSKLDWSEADLVYYFESGLTPDYDSVGGSMASVVTNLAKLPKSDRAAIAAYLKEVPAVP
jgi:mono/diheme cytochrome c family protein